MDIYIVIIAATLTIGLLANVKMDKTSIQLMLLGIELTIVGAVLIAIAGLGGLNIIFYLAGMALPIVGLIITVYGFIKK